MLNLARLPFRAAEEAPRAARYLADPRLSISEVAYLLGYSELRAFDRAFVRWYRQTPSA